MSFSTGYTFGFAAAVCVVCSLAVASAAVSLKPIQDLNKERDQKRSILSALQLPEDGSVPVGEAIDTLWDSRVEVRFITPDGKPVDRSDTSFDLNGDGEVTLLDAAEARKRARGTDAPPKLLAVYERRDGDQVGALALEVAGMGLWGPVSGFLAIAPDASEVIGATFFAPKETPGLGAEIVEDSFTSQFEGKKLFRDGEPRGIRVAKGKVSDSDPARGEPEHWVDGVSGATITCRGVSEMLERGIESYYAEFLQKLRT